MGRWLPSVGRYRNHCGCGLQLHSLTSYGEIQIRFCGNRQHSAVSTNLLKLPSEQDYPSDPLRFPSETLKDQGGHQEEVCQSKEDDPHRRRAACR